MTKGMRGGYREGLWIKRLVYISKAMIGVYPENYESYPAC